jgi:hypothetical protein
LSRSLRASERDTGIAERLGELEASLEAELRRAEQIAGELDRLGERPVSESAEALSATA